MTQTRTENPLLTKDIWQNCIFAFLDKKTLYTFASISKEARQLVFDNLFKQKDFSAWVNREIEHLTIVTDRRFAKYAPPLEFELNVQLGATSKAMVTRAEEVFSWVGTAVMIKHFSQNPSSLAGLITLLFAGQAALLHRSFNNTNEKWIKRDQEEAKRQEESHRKKYGLTYLRDELPGLTFAEHRLFAKPYGSAQNQSDVPAKIADKRDLHYKETLFSKWGCIIHDFMQESTPRNHF